MPFIIKHKNGKYLAEPVVSGTNYDNYYFTSNKTDIKILIFNNIRNAKKEINHLEIKLLEIFKYTKIKKNCKIIEVKLNNRFQEI